MKNFSCFISLLFLSNFAFAQSDSSFLQKKDTASYTVFLESKFESNSNAVPNTMLAKLLWGGMMSKDFLTQTRDILHDNNNRFGFEFKNQASISWKSKNFDWTAGLKYRELLGMSFSKDLFGLAFLGNTAYDGRSADLSNTKFQYTQYAGASIEMKKKLKWGTIYTGISALYGLNYQSLRTRQASIYTAPDARYIQTDGEMKLHYQSPKHGVGLGIDLAYLYVWKQQAVSFSIEDLGFMNWQKMTSFEGTSNTMYSGEEIANITNYTGDSLFSDFSTRGFGKRFGINETQKNLTTLLPFAITARYQNQLTYKWKLLGEVYYTYMPAYIPRVSTKLEHTFNNNWNVNAGLAYGGFGKWNTLIGAYKTFQHNWSLHFETYFLGMVLVPKKSHGIGLGFRISKGF